jgi:hypothetical protein
MTLTTPPSGHRQEQGALQADAGLQEHRGMENGIAIDPIALQREDEHDLAKDIAA